MDERLKESLSALLDGEADELELQRLLAQSERGELRSLWSRYHQVRNVFGIEDARLHTLDVSHAVARAIGNHELAAPLTSTSASQQQALVRARRESRIWKMGAVAASVVGAFVLGLSLQQAHKPAANVDPARALAVQTDALPTMAPSTSSLAPRQVSGEPSMQTVLVSARQQPEPVSQVELAAREQIGALLAKDAQRPMRINEHLSEAQARRLNEYMLRHAEQATLASRSGVVPLARVVAVNTSGR